MVVSSRLLSSSLSLPIAAKCGHCRHANSDDSMRSIFMEQQVSIVLYSDDIPKYKNLFLLFHTYLVSCAKVRDARGYLIRAGRYEWVADKYTIVEPITDNDGLEAPLAALEKLSPLPFSAIEQQHPGSEFDLLAVVVNCSALQYTVDQSKHFREAIVMDQRQGEADRTNVVVLYFRSSSSSTSSLNLAPIEDQVQSISTIPQSLSMCDLSNDCSSVPNPTAKPGKVVGPGFAYDFGNKEKHDSRPQSRNVVDPPPQIMPSAYC
ncbi:hypothetical protein FXO38_26940 [Capsicum annuum]|nr:hypothetical protein FXO38_26940 [Capsicum annuum]